MTSRRAPLPPESAPRRFRLIIDSHPLSPNRAAAASLRQRLRDKRQFREAAAWKSRQVHQGPPLERARVTITLVRPDRQFYDEDNAVATTKHLVDGLCVQHGGTLLAGDDSAHLELVVRQERGPHRVAVIDVEEAS